MGAGKVFRNFRHQFLHRDFTHTATNETTSRKSGLPRGGHHKKLKLSSSGNIKDKEKKIFKKIDLKSANMKLKQHDVVKPKHSKQSSNSRGNANKYKQSSNKKSRNYMEHAFTE